MRQLVSLSAVGLLSAIGTWISIRVANAHNYMDHPNQIKIHVSPVPRLGGTGIAAGLLFGLILLIAQVPDAQKTGIGLLGVALFTTFLTGLLDDIYSLSPFWKLGGLAAGALVISFGCSLPILAAPLPGYVFSLLVVIGMANAVNLVDGMDALAGSIVAVALLSFTIVFHAAGSPMQASIAMAGVAATAGFLVFNRHPARTFMGDSGSLLLGCLLGYLLISAVAVSLKQAWGAFVICLVPIWDTTAAIVRRICGHGSVLEGDRRHSYDLLYALSHSYVKTMIGMIAAAVLCGACGIAIAQSDGFVVPAVLSVVLIGILVTASILLGVFSPGPSSAHGKASHNNAVTSNS